MEVEIVVAFKSPEIAVDAVVIVYGALLEFEVEFNVMLELRVELAVLLEPRLELVLRVIFELLALAFEIWTTIGLAVEFVLEFVIELAL